MRSSERSPRHKRLAGGQQSDDAVYFSGLQGFLQRERRQYGSQPLGQHRFSSAGRAYQQHVMATRSGDLQRALDRLLTLYLGEIDFVLMVLLEDPGDVHLAR